MTCPGFDQEARTKTSIEDAATAEDQSFESQDLPAGASDAASAAVRGTNDDDGEDLRLHAKRVLEALLFASPTPLKAANLADHLPEGTDVTGVLVELQADYAGRGVKLVRVAGGWMFQTAEDLGYLLDQHIHEERRLSRAALETLAIIAYHQPCTRAEIEEVRGVSTSKGTLDALMDIGWVRPRGRRRAPGRPVTYATTDAFLVHFSLESVKDLPGLAELKGTGLLDGNLPPDFHMPAPRDLAALLPDELPLVDEAEDGHDELDLEQERQAGNAGQQRPVEHGETEARPDEGSDRKPATARGR